MADSLTGTDRAEIVEQLRAVADELDDADMRRRRAMN
jgi:hypothetical protein